MTVLAVVHPTDLVATDLRAALDDHTELWDELRLLAIDDAEAGTLTETRGHAALVAAIDDDSFDGVDVAFLCGPMARLRPLLERVPATTAVVLLAPDAGPEDGHPVVVGVSHEQLPTRRALISPNAGAVALAHLLHPLRALRPRRAVATLMQPVSVYGKEGLDALFEQTRDALSFETPSTAFLPRQLAFNVIHAGDDSRSLEAHVAMVLGGEPPLSVQILRAGIFHGLSISLHVELSGEPTREAVIEALSSHGLVDFTEDDALLGPIDVAAREEVLVGRIEQDTSRPGCFKIWAVMDNLTRGGALNALGILEALRSPLVS
jgi:aspartate-semialdehyde dehydrogenase